LLTDRGKKKDNLNSLKKRGISTSKKKSRANNIKMETPNTVLKMKKNNSK
jgi:hypothetical protein